MNENNLKLARVSWKSRQDKCKSKVILVSVFSNNGIIFSQIVPSKNTPSTALEEDGVNIIYNREGTVVVQKRAVNFHARRYNAYFIFCFFLIVGFQKKFKFWDRGEINRKCLGIENLHILPIL